MEIKKFLEKFKSYSTADTSKIEQAYEFAKKMHKNQLRASGDNHFTHCQTVADILMDHKFDADTICAALLHDTLEDTSVTLPQLEQKFGVEVAGMVNGVTKIADLKFNSQDEEIASNWRKMLIATAKDIRIILIKLADRIHNMRTIQYLPKEKQIRKSKETMMLYAPLAQRLGMFNMKGELEDLSFKILNPKEYEELAIKTERLLGKRHETLKKVKKEIESKLSETKINFRILMRAKNIYSFYRKMETQNISFEEIEDSLGVRIITDTVADCYGILGLLHANFKPVAGSFTDYIAIPKANLYQSIHTTVVTSSGETVEVQIRTEEMHYKNEYGIAAHWRYKLGGVSDKHFDEKLNWVRQWLEWLQDLTNPREFLESFQTDMDLEQVFVFTPKGEVKSLPKGSTILDFAYAVHTEVGNKCMGAKVNGKIAPLNYELKSGQFCEILTKKNQKPSSDWLKNVKTARARSKIRNFLKGLE
ncbi:MAG TPA: RelA/SpoT family protein [Elusimicrobiales bacterium]|nr:RelA/SpoT family protein [Elusimicrobiales bacterium]